MDGSPFDEESIQKLFGHEAAEDEDPKRLREYYFKTTAYNQVAANVPLRVLVGHKGMGKSALFQVAISESAERGKLPILIQPNDIAGLPIDADDFLETIRNWTEGLTSVIARKALEQIGITNLALAADHPHRARGPIEVVLDVLQHASPQDCRAGSDDAMLEFLDKPALEVFIDDLDRGWEGRKSDVRRISALLNAVRDLSNRDKRMTFKVALRSDVYYLVRTSDESTDKIEGSVIWHTWTNHEIFVLLLKRIETYFGRDVQEGELLKRRQSDLAHLLDPIMEPRFTGRGHWANAPTYRVLMSLIRKRPRDLVKLCTLAARQAYNRGATKIATEHLEAIFEEYSRGRVQDTVNEYRSELPDIEALILNMKPNRKEREARQGYVYNTAALLEKLGNIMQSHALRFADRREPSRQDVAAFLYKINFLTARKETEAGIVRKYFEDNQYLSAALADFGFDWEVHPAYRWALQPESVQDIYNLLRLTADDD